jgi:hypothetical protein
MLHMSLADAAAQVEAWLRARLLSPRLSGLVHASLLAVAALLFVYRTRPVLLACFRSHEVSEYDQYKFLSGATAQYDVVLSDLATSDYVPAFTGKVVAMLKPLPFVPDAEARRADVTRFFSASCPQAEREQIIRKYDVKWILLNKESVPGWAAIAQAFQGEAETARSNDQFALLRLDQSDSVLKHAQP